MKYKAPEGHTGIDVGGQHFPVDADGCIHVPNGNYDNLLRPQGYEPVVEEADTQSGEGGGNDEQHQ